MERVDDSASLDVLRRANACFHRFFDGLSHARTPDDDEELGALLQLKEVLESVGALLDGRLQAATDRDIRAALGCYRDNLIRLRCELALLEGSAIACRARLDSRRQHLYAAKAWSAARRAFT